MKELSIYLDHILPDASHEEKLILQRLLQCLQQFPRHRNPYSALPLLEGFVEQTQNFHAWLLRQAVGSPSTSPSADYVPTDPPSETLR